jgi:2-oxoglutarate ferredoxin oxidoreductase subunit gamma
MLTRIRLGGLGGQGVVLAGTVLGEAATLAGLNAAGSNSYGAAARGIACRSDVVVSDAEIGFPHLDRADVLAVMSQAAYEKYKPVLDPKGVVFYDDFAVHPVDPGDVPHHAVPATAVAVREFGNRQGGNIVLTGAVVGATRVLPVEAVRDAIRRHVRARFLDANLKALDLGLEIGNRIRTGAGGEGG